VIDVTCLKQITNAIQSFPKFKITLIFFCQSAPLAAVEFLQSELTSAGAYIVRTETAGASTMTVALSNGRLMVFHTSADQSPNNKPFSKTNSSNDIIFFHQV
jgi:hypothetical protein